VLLKFEWLVFDRLWQIATITASGELSEVSIIYDL
jgi:hypothetical protein